MTMQPFLLSAILHKIGSIPVQFESDLVRARNLASLLAQEMHFEKTSCIRVGTAVSELTRNMIEHAQGGTVEFSIACRNNKSSGIVIIFRDRGPGIQNLQEIQSGSFVSKKGMGVGLSGSQRLMDDFDIKTQSGKGTTITATKWLPSFSPEPDSNQIRAIQQAFQKTIERGDASMMETINAQNIELIFLLKKIQERNEEIETINQELEETNKGVVALNRELEDKAIAIEKAKQQAELANKAKSEFLAHMSHEIRTPMNAILGFTEILQQKISDPTQQKYLEAISSGGKALLGIINDILDLSKIEAGKMELHFNSVNLHSLLNEVGQIFKHRTREKQIEFILEIDPKIPEGLVLDDVRLRQILINLAGNAVKFTHRGFVKLSARQADHAYEGNGINLLFIVEDSGIGIPQDQIETIFMAFEQQKDQDINKYGGTGLGLTITSRLIKMMDGNITVESNVNKGSRFIVKLSNIQIAGKETPKRHEDTEDTDDIIFKPATLLLADDIFTNRDLVKSMLENAPFKIIEAINGEEAIRAARIHLPDLILMDIKMPVLNGFEAIKILRKDEILKKIPVIAFTASALREDQNRILDAGFNGYLTKPLSRYQLISEFKKFIDYEIVEKNPPVESAKDLISAFYSEAPVKNLQVLINLICGDYYRKWQAIRNTFIMNEIIMFAKEIQWAGEEYKSRQLKSWGEIVEAQAAGFDMDELPVTLNQFTKIVDYYSALKNEQQQNYD